MAIYQLGVEEILAERPFTHPHASHHDLAFMQEMCQILCQYIQSLLAASVPDNHITRQFEDENRAIHRLVLPNWPQVATQAPLTAVGFFGQARLDIDHTPILDLENSLIAAMPDTPGLLTYYNLYWPGRGWGNLVLFSHDQAKNNWGYDACHRQAVQLSPHHYHSIRLHNGRLPHGLCASPQIILTTTKYLDYNTTPMWRAVRPL